MSDIYHFPSGNNQEGFDCRPKKDIYNPIFKIENNAPGSFQRRRERKILIKISTPRREENTIDMVMEVGV